MSAELSATVQRRRDVTGTHNLRDVGGYPTSDGETRWGRLFRSDALHLLDDSGRLALRELGVRSIVDLRGDVERTASPSAIDGLGIRMHHLPIFDDAAPDAQVVVTASLAPLYDHIVDERGAQLAEAVRVIARAGDDEAVLVHCTAGKDRTGLVVALALAAVGVERDDIVADYAATAENLRGEWTDRMLERVAEMGAELTPGMVEIVSLSPAPVMAALLERIDREHGSAADYLVAQGLDPADLDRLSASLIAANQGGTP